MPFALPSTNPFSRPGVVGIYLRPGGVCGDGDAITLSLEDEVGSGILLTLFNGGELGEPYSSCVVVAGVKFRGRLPNVGEDGPSAGFSAGGGMGSESGRDGGSERNGLISAGARGIGGGFCLGDFGVDVGRPVGNDGGRY